MVRVGFLKKLLSVFLAFSMLLICLPGAFAVTTEPATQASSTTQQMTEATEPATQASSATQQVTEATEPATMDLFDKFSKEEIEEGYQFGAVLVYCPKVEKIAELLPDFEVVSEWYFAPDIKYVKFKEKTKEIVWKAIEVLKASGENAKPNRIYDMETEAGYEFGKIVVKNPPAPIEEMLPGFEIVSVWHLFYGYYYVDFKEKTQEIVWRAIGLLKANGVYAEVRPIYSTEPITEPTETTEPATQASSAAQQVTEATEPAKMGPFDKFSKEEIEAGYPFGEVRVYHPKASISELLPGFEIVSEREFDGIIYVTFKEKTKEIVWKAIEVLKASGEDATPNYFYHTDEEPITEPTEITEPATQASSATQQVTEATESTSLTENTAVTNTENNIIMGDADGDGRLTVADATCVQKFLVAIISEQEIDLSAANISKSGTISVRDATEIQRKLVGLLSDW